MVDSLADNVTPNPVTTGVYVTFCGGIEEPQTNQYFPDAEKITVVEGVLMLLNHFDETTIAFNTSEWAQAKLANPCYRRRLGFRPT